MNISKFHESAKTAVAKLTAGNQFDARTVRRLENTVLAAVLKQAGYGDNAKYVAEYQANPHYARLGLNVDDYCATRRIDDGLEPLESKAENQPADDAPTLSDPLIGNGQTPYCIDSDEI